MEYWLILSFSGLSVLEQEHTQSSRRDISNIDIDLLMTLHLWSGHARLLTDRDCPLSIYLTVLAVARRFTHAYDY